MRSPAIANDFDMTPIDTARSSRSAPAGSVSRRRAQSDDLVGHEADPGGAHGAEASPLRLGREHARGLVGRVDDDHPRLRPERPDQPVHVERPAVLLAERVQADRCARGARDLVQRLVAGPRDDDVVAFLERGRQEAEDRLLGAGEDEHVVRLDRVVQRRDLGATTDFNRSV
jgi:hypothetical protein